MCNLPTECLALVEEGTRQLFGQEPELAKQSRTLPDLGIGRLPVPKSGSELRRKEAVKRISLHECGFLSSASFSSGSHASILLYTFVHSFVLDRSTSYPPDLVLEMH